VDAAGAPIKGTIITEKDVSLAPLADRTVAVIGYGTMGRAHAVNLRRSGIATLVGLRPGSAAARVAVADGLTVLGVSEAVVRADVVVLLLPDQVMAEVYTAAIAPHLRPDAALGFAHGFAIAFDLIRPESRRPCFLVAPKGQGDMLREAFAAGGGLPGLLAVTDDSPPQTWQLAAAYARAVGCLRGGATATTFRHECLSDLFGEQVVLCGGVIELLQTAFDTLVSRGYDAENAYFECVYELKLIVDLIQRYGIDGMRGRISGTAAYGGLTRGPRVIDASVRARIEGILDEIESGAFAREFLARYADTEHGTAALAAREAASPLAQAGRRLQDRLRALDTAGSGADGAGEAEDVADSSDAARPD